MRTISLTATKTIRRMRFQYRISKRVMSLGTLLCFFYAAASAAPIILHPGSDVSNQTVHAIEEGFASVLDLYEQQFGYRLKGPANAYASSDPEFLAKAKIKERGYPISDLPSQVLKWANERRENEAGYRFLIMKANGTAFTGGAKPQKRPLQQMLSHEIFHLIQFELVGTKGRKCCNQNKVSVVGPTWLMEGSAEYAMYVFGNANLQRPMERSVEEMRRRSAGFKGGLSDLETGTTFYQTRNSYSVGAYATHLLVSKSEPESIIKFYSSLRQTSNWKKAFSAAFGISVVDFYKEFENR